MVFLNFLKAKGFISVLIIVIKLSQHIYMI